MKTRRNRSRRAAALGAALFFFVLVSIAGTALLGMSVITRKNFVRNGEDVRLTIAAEAGLETRRGMFVLVSGVQDDWSKVLPSTGWNKIGNDLNVNGIRVSVEAQAVGYPGTLQARMRSSAFGATRTRVVEYTIQAANFADYALYFGSTSTVGIGANFKMVGNFYSKGSIDLGKSAGIEFFSRVETSQKILNAPDRAYNFKKGSLEYVPEIEIPSSAYGMGPMRTAAAASSTLFYANTRSIELVGKKFRRTFEYRTKGTGTTYKSSEYETRNELVDIPDNSVVYIDNSTAPDGVDTYKSASNTANKAAASTVDMWGVLDTQRVTLACESDIRVINNVSYQSLLSNPNLRRFSVKDSAAALNYREMLGVLSAKDVIFETASWSALPTASKVTDSTAYTPADVGHEKYQYSLDGVFMGVNQAARGGTNSPSDRELWVCGGIINGNYSTTALSSNFDRRNYDTDYRLRLNTPPYFLRAYGASPTYVAGTWRTFEA